MLGSGNHITRFETSVRVFDLISLVSASALISDSGAFLQSKHLSEDSQIACDNKMHRLSIFVRLEGVVKH